ncbi:hypothetical protein [Sorangium sp. So ce406]|uniref:hypothetical protein n=1 Tax=Sorangium sp. So ce406 TaxID=3133311 RepID=UPI003F5BE289
MQDETLPRVPRFNAWREWKPIIATCNEDEFFRTEDAARRLPSPQTKAIYLYSEFTGCTGIEFVLISNTSDKASFRRLPHGIIIVPCPQPPFSTPPDVSLYDGWMPLSDSSPEVITKGISDLDETISLWSHVFDSSTQMFIKYVECVGGRPPMWIVEDSDYESIDRISARLRELPTVLQTATIRSLHWRQHAQAQIRPTDKLLALWQAFESLLAAAYDYAAELELPIDDPMRLLSKRQRNKFKAELAKKIIDAEFQANPLEAVQHAYFDAVKGIRRRCEAALRAIIGPDDPRIHQMFDTDPSIWSPNRIRNLLMHEGCSATEVEIACDIRSRVESLDDLVVEIITRILRRRWLGEPLSTRQRQATISHIPLNTIPCAPRGGFVVQGNFTISFQLMWAKGLR